MRCCEFCGLIVSDCSCQVTEEFLDNLYDHDFHSYNDQISRLGKLELEND